MKCNGVGLSWGSCCKVLSVITWACCIRYESESVVFGMKRPMQFLTKMHQLFVSDRLLILTHVFFASTHFHGGKQWNEPNAHCLQHRQTAEVWQVMSLRLCNLMRSQLVEEYRSFLSNFQPFHIPCSPTREIFDQRKDVILSQHPDAFSFCWCVCSL